MPRCFPPDPDFAEDRRAERAVWEALRDQLPDDAALFHSLQLKEGTRDAEADLVIVWPDVGVAVVEVKGGVVSHRGGQWFQSGRNGEHSIRDPIVQAQDCKHILTRYLRARANPAADAPTAHLVAFPFSSIPLDWELPGCPRAMVIAKGQLDQAASLVRTAIALHGEGRLALTKKDTERFIATVDGQLGGQTSLLTDAEEHEVRVDQMTRDQRSILSALSMQRRLKVLGGAGTGKTWLALEQARRLAASGERVALVCYSRGLARFFERYVETWPMQERPAYVGLFHALPLLWGADPPPADASNLDAQSDYYERALPEQMAQLAQTLPDEDRFDSIIVDEAQDFGEAWWPPTMASLRDQEASGLFAFLDEAQRIFNRSGEVPIPLPPILLGENIRNTKRIAQTFGSLADAQMTYRGLRGLPVRFVQCATQDALDAADDQIDGLIAEGWQPGRIALLTTGRRHTEQSEAVETYGGWAAYWDDFFGETGVFYGHVLGFKGLERAVVVLAVNGIRDTDRAREYLYVGLSRGRTQLVVCGDLDEIEGFGGTGLRRRLEAAEQRPWTPEP